MLEKTIFILGVTSDIGYALSKYFSQDGYKVVGTYRNKNSLFDTLQETDGDFIQCDINDINSVKTAVGKFSTLHTHWDIFISCVGSMEPIGSFFTCNFDEWEQSVVTNSTAQLRVVHELYPYRRIDETCHVAFFAGGGTNNAFKNYSAYCVSKIMLIKMCELLDDENSDLNVFIVGPGWVRTKIHEQTLGNPSGAGDSYQSTLDFLGSKTSGTSEKDIYGCIKWCITHGKHVAGGRNLSVVHDPWKNEGMGLAEQLLNDTDKYKLRRFKNND